MHPGACGQPPRPDWQTTFDWRHEYNHVRPHLAAVPASRSPRSYPAQYGPEDQIRRVQAGGWVSFQGRDLRAQGAAGAARGVSPDRHRWLLGHPLPDGHLGTLDLREPA